VAELRLRTLRAELDVVPQTVAGPGDSPVDSSTLHRLIGTMQNVQAAQGLLVSSGGFKSWVSPNPTQSGRKCTFRSATGHPCGGSKNSTLPHGENDCGAMADRSPKNGPLQTKSCQRLRSKASSQAFHV
jgi:hypothetical protein